VKKKVYLGQSTLSAFMVSQDLRFLDTGRALSRGLVQQDKPIGAAKEINVRSSKIKYALNGSSYSPDWQGWGISTGI
jgi:hypothetical protein